MYTRFLIVDGNSIACRAAYKLPHLHTSTGVPTGGTHLFFIMLDNILNKVKPTHVMIAWDVSRNTFRSKLYKNYKGNRGIGGQQDSLKQQFKQISEILRLSNIAQLGVEGFEADDVIGTYAALSNAHENYILTGDKDSFQLLNDNTRVFFPKTGISEIELIDIKRFQEIFGITVSQFIDYKTLAGDNSDNINGCPSCGNKIAVRLLNKYGSLDGVVENSEEIKGKLGEHLRKWVNEIPITKKLVTIRKDVPVTYSFNECYFNPTWKDSMEYMGSLELNILIAKLKDGDFYGQI